MIAKHNISLHLATVGHDKELQIKKWMKSTWARDWSQLGTKKNPANSRALLPQNCLCPRMSAGPNYLNCMTSYFSIDVLGTSSLYNIVFAYRLFTWWTCNRLAKGNRRVMSGQSGGNTQRIMKTTQALMIQVNKELTVLLLYYTKRRKTN